MLARENFDGLHVWASPVCLVYLAEDVHLVYLVCPVGLAYAIS